MPLKTVKNRAACKCKKSQHTPFPPRSEVDHRGGTVDMKICIQFAIHSHLPRDILVIRFSFQCFSTLHKIKFEAKQTPSQKPSILYRNRTRNEPFFLNFRENPFGELDLRSGIWDIPPSDFFLTKCT